MKTVLTVDSGICPIAREDTIVIPAQVISSSMDTYRDNGKEISNREMLESGNRYHTSAPLMGDFEETFRRLLSSGVDVVHLSMSSGISEGSVNISQLVADICNEEYTNQVYVVDSLTGATGGTLLYEVIYQQLLTSNLSAKELCSALEKLKKKIQTSFYVPDASGYVQSGRDRSSSHLVDHALSWSTRLANLTSLKFRVDFHENGDLYLKKIFRSSSKNGMLQMVKDIVNDETIKNYDLQRVVVGNLYPKDVDMEVVKSYLSQYFDQVLEREIGAVVAAYGCPDLCGLALVKK